MSMHIDKLDERYFTVLFSAAHLHGPEPHVQLRLIALLGKATVPSKLHTVEL